MTEWSEEDWRAKLYAGTNTTLQPIQQEIMETGTDPSFDPSPSEVKQLEALTEQYQPVTLEELQAVKVSNSSRVQQIYELLQAFPRRRVPISNLAERLNCTRTQTYAAMLNMKRRDLPVHSDNVGGSHAAHYWYDNSETRQRVETVDEPDEFHHTAVVLYELFESRATHDEDEDNPVVMATAFDLLPYLNSEDRQLFYNRRGVNQRLVLQVHDYLTRIGSIRVIGSRKYLLQHPDVAIKQDGATTNTGNMDYAGHIVEAPDPYEEAKRRRQGPDTFIDLTPTPEPEYTPPQPHDQGEPTPGDTTVAITHGVDEDVLARAVAHGMWTRYEMAVTAVGEAQEVIARLEQALRNKDQEIARLRSQIPNPTVADIATRLLTPETD